MEKDSAEANERGVNCDIEWVRSVGNCEFSIVSKGMFYFFELFFKFRSPFESDIVMK